MGGWRRQDAPHREAATWKGRWMSRLISTANYILKHPGGGWRGLARFIQWQVVTRLRPGETLLVPWLNDTHLAVRRGDHGLTGNIYCTLLEYDEMGFFLTTLRRGDTFVDVGANGGAYTVLAAGVRGCRVLAFEPVPSTARTLILNVEVNEISALVEVHQEALSGFVGFGAMDIPDSPTAFLKTDSLGEGNEGLDLTTPVTTLDSRLTVVGPTFLKVDVEGGELGVIDGSSRTLQEPQVLAASVEVAWDGTALSSSSHGVVAAMQRFDYTPYVFDFASQRISPGIRHGQRNVLFIRDIDAVRQRLAESPLLRMPNEVRLRLAALTHEQDE